MTMIPDSTLISFGALVFSGIAVAVSLRTRAEADKARMRAAVSVTLLTTPAFVGASSQVVVANAGPSDARNIQISFPDGKSPINEADVREKLPIPVLRPGSSVPLLASLSKNMYPPFRIVLTWVDDSGDRRAEDTLA